MGIKWGKDTKHYPSAADRSPTANENVLKFDGTILERFMLVWFDDQLQTTNENVALLAKLRASVNHLRTFINLETCRIFIEAQSVDEPLVLIVSGKCGQELVPLIHDLDQLNSIYIFCMNRGHHITWARLYAKVNIH